jgi:exodeoxyribonuclease VII large subunit
VGRGGGSLEDLWAFNEEIVARAIVASRVPIVSGVGHEIDLSISDLVADARAATPTAAAEMVTPVLSELVERLRRQADRAGRCVRNDMERAALGLARIAGRDSLARPARRLRESAQRLDERMHLLARRMAERFRHVHAALGRAELAILRFGSGAAFARIARGIEARLNRIRTALGRVESRAESRFAQAMGRIRASGPQQRLDRIRDHLDAAAARAERTGVLEIALGRERLAARIERIAAASPASVLARGYSITRDARSGELIRSVQQVRDGQRIEVEVADGRFKATADDPKQPRLFE